MSATPRRCLSIILAAGEGTRMKSALPKVLHPVAGLPMVVHVARAALAAGGDDIAMVVGRAADAVKAATQSVFPGVECFEQTARLGTAHAVLAARTAIARGYDDILVLFGDTPLIDPESLATARQRLAEGATVVVMGFRTDEPAGYGRLIEENGELVAIREDRDCSAKERAITFCNGGLMAIAGAHALDLLDAIGNDNAKSEYYLTDIVAAARARGLSAVALEAPFESLLGINTRVELATAEAVWQDRRRRELMLQGVTMQAPATVYLSFDTEIGADSVLEPHVFFGPGVRIAEKVRIRAYSHLEGARVAAGAEIGPFARLRPGTVIERKSRVGNFCEIKNTILEEGAKVNHLAYVGDAEVGAGANVGAGTITCNYDGFGKFRTEIGAGAFIGSNSSLVAPIRIGRGAYVASGSVVTEDVPDDALAFGRARQVTKEGRARILRERKSAEKTQS
jgi:bifunctional UDP-N-acetylglucosamine pyrophosphorylase/glucosamine-1-phosphate N-acetyltransferase